MPVSRIIGIRVTGARILWVSCSIVAHGRSLMRQKSSPPQQEFIQLFTSSRGGAQRARVSATQHLASWGYVTDSAALLVAELAANAVTHGRAPNRGFLLRLAVSSGGPEMLRIEVSDARADQRPSLQRCSPADDAENGRGLLLIQALCTRWGVTGRSFGKTVWAELALEAVAPGDRRGDYVCEPKAPR